MDSLTGKISQQRSSLSANFPLLIEAFRPMKKLLGEIINNTRTYLPDAIFDEVFKRIGYPLIDYLINQ
jgi:hypothetical protein